MHDAFPDPEHYARCETLEHEITELAAHLHAATYRLLCLIREFDERGGWVGVGVMSCAHWLNWQCGISLSAAHEKVRVSHALEGLPLIRAAFARGELSYSKVRAMTRAATPENEEYLLMVAQHGTASHVEKLMRAYRGVERTEARARAERQHEEREVRYYTDEDGALVIQARLPAERGAVVLKALQAAMEALAKDEAAAETMDEHPPAADVLETTLTLPSAEGVGAQTEERPSVCQRRADGLVLMAETLLETGVKASRSAERYQVVVHVAAETLQTGGPGRCDLEDGPAIAAETAQRLACDASLVLLVEDEEGQPLSVGRKTRAIPPAINRALRARDDGCRFPGCTHRHFLHAHHIRPWAKGGETALSNLATLCQFHHRLVHEGGYGCALNDAGALVFTRPDGRVLGAAPPKLTPDTGTSIEADNRKQGLEIDSQTCVPRWHGEVMDCGMAIDVLLQCAGKLNGPAPPAGP